MPGRYSESAEVGREAKRIICRIGLGANTGGMTNLGDLANERERWALARPCPTLRRNTYFAAVSAAFDNTPNGPKRLSSESLPAPKATT
jgi:hypothetical protein